MDEIYIYSFSKNASTWNEVLAQRKQLRFTLPKMPYARSDWRDAVGNKYEKISQKAFDEMTKEIKNFFDGLRSDDPNFDIEKVYYKSQKAEIEACVRGA